ncbi:MAG TPA: protein kinase, partial [bacterium]|nr:protein kinase [bacterium]
WDGRKYSICDGPSVIPGWFFIEPARESTRANEALVIPAEAGIQAKTTLDSPVEPGNDTSTVALSDSFVENDFRDYVIRNLRAAHSASIHTDSAFRQYYKRLGVIDQLRVEKTYPSLSNYSKRSEVRSIPLSPAILLDKKLPPGRRLQLWIDDLSKKINAALSNSLDQNLLAHVLSRLAWVSSESEIESKLAKLLQEKSLSIEFSKDLSLPVEWTRGYDRLKNIALKIDARGIMAFRSTKSEGVLDDSSASQARRKQTVDYLSVIYIALVLRNYLIGHALKRNEEMPAIPNSDKRDSSKRFEINRKFVDEILGLGGIGKVQRDDLQEALDRHAFITALAQINSPDNPDFSGSTDFLTKLQEQLNTFENWLSIALPFDAKGRELAAEATDAHRNKRQAEAKNLKSRAVAVYEGIPLLGGRYKVVSYIASGGFGAVYKVLDTRVNDYRVIKVFDNRNRGERKRQEKKNFRLEREVELHKKVKGLGRFPQIHDQEGLIASHQGASGYLVLDLIGGKTVDKWMAAGLNVDEAVEIVMKAAEGLERFHERGMIHRDLKPQNLMADIHNGNIEVTVLDLGLAKDEELSQIAGDQTMAGTIMGTPGYIPPETGGYGGRVSPSSDVFQLGMILAQLLDPRGKDRIPGFQKAARPQETILSTLIAQAEGRYASPRDNSPTQVDPKLNTIVLKAMAPLSEHLPNIVNTIVSEMNMKVEGERAKLRDNRGEPLSDKKIIQLHKILAERSADLNAVIKKFNIAVRYDKAGHLARDLKTWLDANRANHQGTRSIRKVISTVSPAKRQENIDPFLKETSMLNPDIVIRPQDEYVPAPRDNRRKFLIYGGIAAATALGGIITTAFWPAKTIPPDNTNGNTNGSTNTKGITQSNKLPGSIYLKGDGKDGIEIEGLLDEPKEGTLAVWVKIEKSGSLGASVLSLGNSFLIYNISDPRKGISGAFFDLDKSPNNVVSQKNIADSGFHFVVFSVGKEVQILYLDGKEIAKTNKRTTIEYKQGQNTVIGLHGDKADPLSDQFKFHGSVARASAWKK